MSDFQLVSPHEPAGDQPQAIAELSEGLVRGDAHQVLLGATGTGKTFAIAQVIARHGRPTLVAADQSVSRHVGTERLQADLSDLWPVPAGVVVSAYRRGQGREVNGQWTWNRPNVDRQRDFPFHSR